MQAAEAILPRYRCNNTGAEVQAITIGAVATDKSARTTTLLPATLDGPHIDLPLEFYFDEKPTTGDVFVKQGEQYFCLAADDFADLYTKLEPVNVA